MAAGCCFDDIAVNVVSTTLQSDSCQMHKGLLLG
jgi:hypothetical protein